MSNDRMHCKKGNLHWLIVLGNWYAETGCKNYSKNKKVSMKFNYEKDDITWTKPTIDFVKGKHILRVVLEFCEV